MLVGSAAAFAAGRFRLDLFLVTLLASVAIHAAVNLVNDYYDHIRGVDTDTSIGPSLAIQMRLLAPQTIMRAAWGLFAVGGLLGLALVAVAGWPILLVGVLSILAGYAYTGGPVPLGYLGLGDLVVFAFMGPVIVLGSYYVQARVVTPTVVWASLPIGALVTAILVVNNLRDLEGDRAHGKHTLATVFGGQGTRWEYGALLIGAYALVLVGVAIHALPIVALVVVLTLPQALRTWRTVHDEIDPKRLTSGGVGGTGRLHQRFGLLLATAFIVARVLP